MSGDGNELEEALSSRSWLKDSKSCEGRGLDGGRHGWAEQRGLWRGDGGRPARQGLDNDFTAAVAAARCRGGVQWRQGFGGDARRGSGGPSAARSSGVVGAGQGRSRRLAASGHEVVSTTRWCGALAMWRLVDEMAVGVAFGGHTSGGSQQTYTDAKEQVLANVREGREGGATERARADGLRRGNGTGRGGVEEDGDGGELWLHQLEVEPAWRRRSSHTGVRRRGDLELQLENGVEGEHKGCEQAASLTAILGGGQRQRARAVARGWWREASAVWSSISSMIATM